MGFDARDTATRYASREGDTLETIAQRETQSGNEMTWQELAKYNFGTDDRDTVNECLRDELGCHKRAPSNDFVMSTSDTGQGELLVPRRFKRTGLAVDRTYTLWVRKKTCPPQFIECWAVPGITFEFDKSFVRLSVVHHLEQLELAANRHPDAKIMIFGHTDKVGTDQYNKGLSERRARSVYAFIVDDADTWEELYNQENWGLRVVKVILTDLGYDPGPFDDSQNAQSTQAIKTYQRDSGLAEDGIAGPITRKQLFHDYMTRSHDVQLTPDRFMDPKHMGCSEFNPEKDTEERHEPNRRVMFYLFHPDRLPKLPCAYGGTAPCQKQMTPPSPRFRSTFRCSFYDSLARNCKCENIPGTKVGQIKLTSPGIEDDKRQSHGAAVAVNDDHDCDQHYGPAPPAGKRELEPIFDLDFLGNTPREDDLLEIKLSMDLKPRTGQVELKATEGGNRIRIWPVPARGADTDFITLPAIIPLSDLPKRLYVEGLDPGRVVLEALCTHPGGAETDQLVINVVQLVETQGGVRKIIYDYNSDIRFEVQGAPANYTFEWDLDGDGNFNTAVFEQGKTAATATCKYGPAEDANTARLDQLPANRRSVYDVAVRMTGGLVLHVRGTTGGEPRGIRVALNSHQGQALPAQTNAGLQARYAWSDNAPVRFNAVGAPAQAGYQAQYAITQPIRGADRVQYGNRVGDYAVTPYEGVGNNRVIHLVAVGPTTWSNGETLEDLDAYMNHEVRHLRQHQAVRDNNPTNNDWRLLDNHYAPGAGGRGYSDFREAHAHLHELREPRAPWRHHTFMSGLQLFFERYNAAMGRYQGLPAGAAKDAAKRILQDLYRQIPFAEMKRGGYDFSVRAPP